MPADPGPPVSSQAKQEQSGAGLVCTPDQLYLHVVGSYPSQEAFGFPGDHDPHGQSPIARSRADDNEDAAGASARAKKRRKTQRRAKVSEIWFPKAEMAFCTSVACIPPNGRTKIKFFGRPLGRNELIAAICTLATRRLYNRKQISSHSQVLKDKVPPVFKEIFTFEDKSRVGEEPGETSTANVIENYSFPEAIYNIIGYRVGTDLANSPKPGWLLDLEAGVPDAQTSMSEAGGPRGAGAYSYWNTPASDYTSWTYDRGGSSSHRKDPYYYGQHGSSSRQQGPYGNQLHTLPPLSLSRDIDAQSPVTTSPSTIGDPLSGGRYPYGSMGSRSHYGDVGRSPPTSTSPYDSQSGASSTMPHPGGDPSVPGTSATAGGQNGHIVLPPLQDNSSSQYSDWKDRSVYQDSSKYAQAPYGSQSSRSGLPPLSNLPSLGSVASQTSGYGLPLSSTPAWASSYGSNWSDQRSLPTFQPTGFEARGRTYDGNQVPLTVNGPLAMGDPMAWHSIYMWRERYPFLEQIAATPGLSVFHIDVYFALPADWGMQMSEMSVDLSLRPPSNETSGWSLVTDSSFLHPSGHVRYPRNATELRLNDSGDLVGSAPTSEMGRLYNYLLADQGRDIETLASIGSPNSAMVQAVMRDNSVSIPSHHVGLPPLGADWNLASTLIIYTFWSPDPDPSRQGLPPQCRPVEFAPPPPLPPVDIGSDPLVAGLLAGEDTQPSKFDWMGTG